MIMDIDVICGCVKTEACVSKVISELLLRLFVRLNVAISALPPRLRACILEKRVTS